MVLNTAPAPLYAHAPRAPNAPRQLLGRGFAGAPGAQALPVPGRGSRELRLGACVLLIWSGARMPAGVSWPHRRLLCNGLIAADSNGGGRSRGRRGWLAWGPLADGWPSCVNVLCSTCTCGGCGAPPEGRLNPESMPESTSSVASTLRFTRVWERLFQSVPHSIGGVCKIQMRSESQMQVYMVCNCKKQRVAWRSIGISYFFAPGPEFDSFGLQPLVCPSPVFASHSTWQACRNSNPV